jgi:hypothetical protein
VSRNANSISSKTIQNKTDKTTEDYNSNNNNKKKKKKKKKNWARISVDGSGLMLKAGSRWFKSI